MAFISGSSMRLVLSGTAGSTTLQDAIVFHCTSTSATFSVDQGDTISSRDTGGGSAWTEVLPRQKSGSVTFNALARTDAAPTGQANISEIWDFFDERALVSWDFMTVPTQDGAVIFSGKGYITDLSISSENDSEVTFDGTVTVSGEVTVTKAGNAPVADFTAADGGSQDITIDASASTATAPATVALYMITIKERPGGGDYYASYTSASATQNEVVGVAGTYDVIVQVKDSEGLLSEPVTKTVTVA